MRKNLIVFLTLLLAAMFSIISCSDRSQNDNLIEGDYSNEDFTLARAEADSAMDEIRIDDNETGDWFLWGGGLYGAPEVDTVSYDSTTGWHLRSRQFEDDFIEASVVDSFRFTDLDSNYQPRRDLTTNIFERRLKKSFEYTSRPDTLYDHWLKTRERNMRWEGLADSVTTLNGDFHRRWEGELGRRGFRREIEGELTGIEFYTRDLMNGRPTYPFDGAFTASMVLDVETPRRQAHIEGTLTVTFYREGRQFCYHARLVRGDNWWEWDRCFTR